MRVAVLEIASRSAFLKTTAAAAVDGYCVVVSGLTVAAGLGVFPTSIVASSPTRVGKGEVWLLLSNGLLAQRPIALSLVALPVLGLAALAVCGTRASLLAAAAGHIGSTLLAYSLVGAVFLIDRGSMKGVLATPDYGVSAVQAAWIGAIAAEAWRRRGQTRRARIAIVGACAAIGAFALVVRSDLTLVDTDHVFAFVIGAALARGLGSGLRLPRSTSARPARVRSRVQALIPLRAVGRGGLPSAPRPTHWDHASAAGDPSGWGGR